MILLWFSLLFSCVLGLGHPEGYVVGGEVAASGDWPWQGSMRGSQGQHWCACTLLHFRWCLTAGHCAQANGAVDIEFGMVERGFGTVVRIKGFVLHPEYGNPDGGESWPNNIALVETADDVPFIPGEIEPIVELDDGTHDWFGYMCMVTGWGAMFEGGGPTTLLMQAELPVVQDDVCVTDWAGQYHPIMHICTKDPNTGTCQGDGGGPLMCRESAGDSWTQVGIISWGSTTCSPSLASVSTRISTYKSWLCMGSDYEIPFCW